MKLLHQGNKARTVEPTAANETSSRSHALLSVLVKQTMRSSARDIRRRARIKQGKLFMIDLAGSERAKQTKVYNYSNIFHLYIIIKNINLRIFYFIFNLKKLINIFIAIIINNIIVLYY